MIRDYLDIAWNRSPCENWRDLARRLFGSKIPQAYSTEIFRSPGYARAQRLYDFFHRYTTIVGHHSDWSFPGFLGRNVLELGSGPLLGWGPLAIFNRCARFVAIEPKFNPRLTEDSRFLEFFLRTLHYDLCALFNETFLFQEFQSAIVNRAIGVNAIEDIDPAIGFDIVLSNSCLEHVQDLQATMDAVYQKANKGSVFLHCVDFGDHVSKSHPFKKIYSDPPNRKRPHSETSINFLRAPDVLNVLQRSGFEAECIPYYSVGEDEQLDLHPYWTERYALEDLRLKVGLFVGYKN